MVDLIKRLSGLRGISGFEYRITDGISEMLRPYCDEVYKDNLGSVIAVKKCGRERAPKIMIEAHCDEVGLIVTSVTDEGFITFANVGGVDLRTLPSSEVIVHGKRDLWGVIGIKPERLLEDGKTVPITDLAVDTGIDKNEVKECVSVGDSITMTQEAHEIGSLLCGKSIDDRAGVAILVSVMKNLSSKMPDADIYAVAAVQEEVGERGAKAAAYGIYPDAAIAIDVTHAVTPDNSQNAFETGVGAAVCKGPNIHPKLYERLIRTAKAHNIKFVTEVDGGNTGTDAWAIQTARDGIPTALISLPLKYMHTSVETISVSDAVDTANLLTYFLLDCGGDLSWLSY